MHVITTTKLRKEDGGLSGICLWKKGSIENISHTVEEYCCEEIKSAMDFGALIFGEVGSYGLNVDCHVNIIKCEPYPEGAVFEEIAIKYCPFCGKEIIITEASNYLR